MNDFITDIFDMWGFASASYTQYIVAILSFFVFALIMYAISRIAYPKASNTRTFLFKTFLVVVSVIIALSCYVNIGANVVIKESSGSSEDVTVTLNEGYYIIHPYHLHLEDSVPIEAETTYTCNTDGYVFAGRSIIESPNDTDKINGVEIYFSAGDYLFVKSGDVIECYSTGLYFLPLSIANINEAINIQ